MWIGQWLEGRVQATVLNGKKSSWLEVLSGVPEESIMYHMNNAPIASDTQEKDIGINISLGLKPTVQCS